MMTTFDRALLQFNRWVVIAILASMALMVFANVALRFLTDHSILWVEEVSRYLMIWLTFLGAGIVLRYGAHIGIDTLQDVFRGAAPAIRAVIFVLLLGFFVAMVWLGVRYARAHLGPDDPGAGNPDRRGVPRDAGRLRADDRPPAADGGALRAAQAIPVRP